MIQLLTEYETYLGAWKPKQKKREIGEKLVKVIQLGCGQFNESQTDALNSFSERFSKTYPKNMVVQCCQGIDIFDLPVEIQNRINFFGPLTSPKSAGAILLAKQKLIEAAESVEPSGKGLSRLVKILFLNWDQGVIEDSKPLKDALLKLVPKVKRFRSIAMVMIKKMEQKETPRGIIDHPAYHGNALKEALSILHEEFMKGSRCAEKLLLTFVHQYCDDHLKPHEYLIRQSSSVPSHPGCFTFTISYKSEDQKVRHFRIIRGETEEGTPFWCSSAKEVVFNTLEEFIQAGGLKNYTPRLPLRNLQIQTYIRSIFTSQ